MKPIKYISLITILICSFSSIEGQSNKLTENANDSVIILSFYRGYQNIRELKLEKVQSERWQKTTTYLDARGHDSSITRPCYQCSKYFTANFLTSLTKIKSHSEANEPCVYSSFLDSIPNSHNIEVRVLEMIPNFSVKLQTLFGGENHIVEHEDPIQALTYCPYQEERMKMLIAMKTLMVVN